MSRLVLAAAAALLTLALAAPASAATFTAPGAPGVPGVPGPGPAKHDRVFVERFGPADAKRVLVLSPGFQGGATSR